MNSELKMREYKIGESVYIPVKLHSSNDNLLRICDEVSYYDDYVINGKCEWFNILDLVISGGFPYVVIEVDRNKYHSSVNFNNKRGWKVNTDVLNMHSMNKEKFICEYCSE